MILWLVTTVHVERAFIHGGLVRYNNIADSMLEGAIAMVLSAASLGLARRNLNDQKVRIAIAIAVVVAVSLGLYGGYERHF
jgi:hypothetical protein